MRRRHSRAAGLPRHRRSQARQEVLQFRQCTACERRIPQFSLIVLGDPLNRRILANRQSAQRSRVRKLQYISELERSVTSLQVRAELRISCPEFRRAPHARAVNLTSNCLRFLFLSSPFFRADGGVGVVTARRVPRPPALAADAGQQPPQAAHRRPRAGQDLQRW